MFLAAFIFSELITIGGVGISLQIVFAVVVGGIYNSLGPTIGALITLLLAEVLRIGIGTEAVCITGKICFNAAGVPLLVYGVMLVLFIVFLPKGIVGAGVDWWRARKKHGLPPRGTMRENSGNP